MRKNRSQNRIKTRGLIENKARLFSLLFSGATALEKLGYILICAVLVLAYYQTKVNAAAQLDVTAYVTDLETKEVASGQYDVRFALYSVNRTDPDPYPSESDSSVWEETQAVKIYNGVLKAFLGETNPLPASIDFDKNQYYLGIRIGQDAEMVPRKRIGAVPLSVTAVTAIKAQDAAALSGAVTGTAAGNIPVIGTGGTIDIALLPTGTSGSTLVLSSDTRLTDAADMTSTVEDSGISNLTADTSSLNVGTGSSLSGNFDITVSKATNPPALRFNGSSGAWQFSNDGTTFADFSTGALDLTGYLPLSGGTMTGAITFYSAQTFGGASLTELGYMSGVSSAVQTQLDAKAASVHAHAASDITSGTLGVTRGGTGLSSISAGSMLYSGSANSLTTLTGLAADDGENLRFNWNGGSPTLSWEAAAGGFTSFTAAGDSGGGRTISNGNVLTIAGGTNVTTVDSDTDTVTVNLDGTLSSVTWNGNAISDSYVSALAGASQGDILYHNGSGWTKLSAGTGGQYLKTQGAGANPAWDAPTGTIYSAGGTLLQLSANTFSIKEGTLTDGLICTYVAGSGPGTGLVCNTSPGGVGTSYTAGSGLTLSGTEFKLGGTITENTTLDLYDSSASRNLRIYNSNTAAEALFVSGSDGNVGIGTTTPSYKLDVVGYANASTGLCIGGTCVTSWSGGGVGQTYTAGSGLTLASSTFKLGGTITEDTTLDLYGSSASRNIRFYNSNTAAEAIYIHGSDGNVGIGTTTPGYNLDVAGSIHATNYYSSDETAGATASTGGLTFKNGLYTAGTMDSLPSGSTGQTLYYTGGAWTATNNLYNNGTNVGIGTTTPGSKMTVNGGGIAVGTSYAGNTAGDGNIIASGNVGIGTTAPNYNLQVVGTVGVGGTAYFSGNVGIGTTTPGYKLDVSGTGRYTGDINGGVEVSEGILYLNPTALSTSPMVQWTATPAWDESGGISGGYGVILGDIDNDGYIDLGEYGMYCCGGDKIAFYRNTASDHSNPVWTYEADWDIANGGFSSLADLNGDNLLDIMEGQASWGTTIIGKSNTGSDSPRWSDEAGWTLTPGGWSRFVPALGSLNSGTDSLVDMMVGKSDGNVYAYKNTGNASAPAWTAESGWDLTGTGKTDATPVLTDLNGDGLLDMLVGFGDNTIRAYRNSGTSTAPAWTREADWEPSGSIADHVAAGDINDDGKPDIMVYTTYAKAYKNTGSGTTDILNNNTIFGIANDGAEKLKINGHGNLSLTASGSSTAASITQSGTGDILNIFDDSDEVFTIIDGGNVGIGTTTPAYKLSIATSTANDRGINISNTAATGTNYGVYASVTGASTANIGGYFTATGATSNYAAIFDAGNVGIGTTTPGSLLTISGGGLAVGTSYAANAAGDGNIIASGNVGIGTTTVSSYKLDVAGTANMTTLSIGGTAVTATGAQLNYLASATGTTGTTSTNIVFSGSPTIATPTFTTSATTPLLIGGTGASSTLTLKSTSGTGTSDAIIFQVGDNGNTEAMRITTGGNVGIGTTTPSEKLSIAGNLVIGAGDGGTPSNVTIRGAAASGTDVAGANMTFDASNGTGSGGSGNIIFRTASAGTASSVTFDAASNANNNWCSEGNPAVTNCFSSWSHTTTAGGSNRILVLTFAVTNGGTGKSVTYGGNALTKFTSSVASGDTIEMWYLVNPPTGSNAISVILNDGFSGGHITGVASTYYNVDSDDPFGTPAITVDPGSANDVSATVSSASGQRVVDAMVVANGIATIAVKTGNNQTSRTVYNGDPGVGTSDKVGAASVTMTWTKSGWAPGTLIAVPLQTVGGGTANTFAERLRIDSNGNVGIGTTTPAYKLSIATSTANDRGVNIANTAATGTNYGVYASVTGAATANIGGYFTATGATTNYGLQVAAMTGATSTGLDIGALSGATANKGINIGAISGAGTAAAVTTGAITSTGATAYQLNLGAISGANATSHTGINLGNISGTTANAYGINLGTLTGGTTANYQINVGAVTSVASATNYNLNLGGTTGTAASSTNYGINVGTMNSTGTANYGVHISQPAGATHDAALVIGTVATASGDWSIYNASTANSYFAGNVGIGTTTPAYKLDVAGQGRFSTALTGGTDADDGIFYLNPTSLSSAPLVQWTLQSSWEPNDSTDALFPDFADLDGDGDKDLMVGMYSDTKIYAYENTGSASSPTWARKSDWDVSVGSSVGRRISMGDLDDDGDYDLVMGSGVNVLAYENTGSSNSPTWARKSDWDKTTASPDSLEADPELFDMNGDGLLDMMVGTYMNGTLGYENTGSASSPTWTREASWDMNLSFCMIQTPDFADLDGDNDYDAIQQCYDSGSGWVKRAFENTGTVATPSWARKADWESSAFQSQLSLEDLDNDGDADMYTTIYGTGDYMYKNTGSLGSIGNTVFGIAVDGSEKLKVTGQGAIALQGYIDLNSYLDLDYAGTATALQVSQSGLGDILNVFDGTDEVFTILDGGNIGIGNATPTHKLHIVDTDDTDGRAGIYVSQTAAITGTGYGGYFTKTGASTTNIGLYVTATGATNNYAAILDAGNVGIGTTTPGYELDVVGYANASSGLCINGDCKTSWSGAGIGSWSANGSDIYNNNAGNVGIGTTTPGYKLNILQAGTAKATTDMLAITNSGNASDMDGTGTGLLFRQYYYDASTPAVVSSGRITVGTQTDWTSTASTQDAYMSFGVAVDGTVTERMRILSSGNVGIGTTTPGAKLDIISTSNATSGTYYLARNQLTINNSSATTGTFEGFYNNVKYSGTANHSTGTIYGIYNYVENTTLTRDINSMYGSRNVVKTNAYGSASGTLSEAVGVSGEIEEDFNGFHVTDAYGVKGTVHNYYSTIGTATGVYASVLSEIGSSATTATGVYATVVNAGSSADMTNAYGVNVYVSNTSSNNITNAKGVSSVLNNGGWSYDQITNGYVYYAATTIDTGYIANAYGMYIDTLQGTNTWGIYQASSTNKNYFAGNVGIGTTAPGYKLNVVTTTAGDQAVRAVNSATTGSNYGGVFIANGSGATANYGLYGNAGNATSNYNLYLDTLAAGANNYSIYSAAAAQSYIAGNVGIGTTAPTRALTVNGDIEIGTNSIGFGTGGVAVDSEAGLRWNGLHVAPDGNYAIYRTSGSWSGPDYQQIIIDWPTGIILDPGNAQAKSYVEIPEGGLRVTSGNVGIGTTTPGQKLEVFDGQFVGSGTGITHGLTAYAATNVWGKIAISAANEGGMQVHGFSDTAGRLGLYLRGTIGVTDPTDTTPAIYMEGSKSNGTTGVAALGDAETVFQVVNYGNTPAITVLGVGNVGIGTTTPQKKLHVAGNIYGVGTVADSSDYPILIQNSTPADVMWVRGDGAGYLLAAAWTYGSDRRMKDNIEYIESGGLDKIMALKPASFDYKSGAKDNLGFIAQDVREVIPEAVSVINPKTGMLGLKTDFIVPYLVRGMQEQQGEISNQQSTISNLDLQISENSADVAGLQTAVNDKLSIVADSLNSIEAEATDQGLQITNIETRLSAAETKLKDDENNFADFQATTTDTLSAMLETENMLTDRVLDHEARIAALEARMATLTVSGGEIPANVITADKNGNVDLAGVLTTKGVVAGDVTIENKDDDSPTIGKAVLKEGETEIVVPTEAVSGKSRILVTPEVTTSQPLAVTEKTAGESFKVEVEEAAEKDIEFSWWIVQSR